MRWTRILHLRARAPLTAGTLALLVNLGGTVPAHAATEQGTIAVTGVGSGPLLACNCSATVATTGYVSGLDGTTPFTVAWGTPGSAPMPALLTLSFFETCSGGLPTPILATNGSGTVSLSGAVLVYNGVHQGATVSGSFTMQSLPATTTLLVVGMTLTIQSGTLAFNVAIGNANGALTIVPTSEYLCPSPAEPVNFAVSGTLLTAG